MKKIIFMIFQPFWWKIQWFWKIIWIVVPSYWDTKINGKVGVRLSSKIIDHSPGHTTTNLMPSSVMPSPSPPSQSDLRHNPTRAPTTRRRESPVLGLCPISSAMISTRPHPLLKIVVDIRRVIPWTARELGHWRACIEARMKAAQLENDCPVEKKVRPRSYCGSRIPWYYKVLFYLELFSK